MLLVKNLSLITLLFLFAGCSTMLSGITDQNTNKVTFYNTYGYLDGDHWIIPMRVYVHHRRRGVERVTTNFASRRYSLNNEEAKIFRSRIKEIVADSEWRESVRFVFDDDPENEEYQLKDEDGNHPRTDLNGLKQGYIKISVQRADELLQLQGSDSGWLTFHAITSRHDGEGKIELIEPEGLSVISDIDDTVKITELPAGSRIVTRNTFFKEFNAAPGMVSLYNNWGNASFHYVSGAPWQLYNPLTNFLFDDNQGFPTGSMHMKNVRKNFFNLSTWRDLRELITNENVTYDQKFGQISNLMETFPNRQFILIGDSGEKYPEIYREIRNRYPDQVSEVYIRDVVNAREHNPERLDGMKIIPARTIQPGITQFQ